MVSKEMVMQSYMERHMLYKDTNKLSVIQEAENLIMNGEYDKADEALKALPSKEELLDRLYVNLKGKPVAKTLRKVLEGKCDNLYQGLKGMFSLGTHICIELEKGNMEYRPLLNDTMAAIHKHLS